MEDSLGPHIMVPDMSTTDEEVQQLCCEGMTVDFSNLMCNVEGSNSTTPMPPSDEKCNYKKGVCNKHKTQGRKYVETTKKWKDRGKGKGYGFVTVKYVRYRCVEKSEPGCL